MVTGTLGGSGRLSPSFPTENGILPAHCLPSPRPPPLLWASAFPQAPERADRFVLPRCTPAFSTTMSQTGASGRCSGHFLSKGGGGGCFQQEQRAFRALAAGFGDRKRKTNFSPLRPAVGKFGAGKLNAAPCWSFSVSQHQNVSCTSSYLNLAKGRGRPRGRTARSAGIGKEDVTGGQAHLDNLPLDELILR